MRELIIRPEVSPEKWGQMRKFFIAYASSFRKEDPLYNEHIKLKQHHTGMVVREISGLADALKLNPGQIAFTEVIAWLHDIGRFEQYDTYGTFADAESENHAELALKVIDKNQLLGGFKKDHEVIVKQAILNHNKRQIPDELPEEIDFYSRLLRDADKLDIWRVTLQKNIFHTIKTGVLPAQYNVPDKLFGYFKKHQVIPLSEVESFYDSILFRLSWVFDLNFRPSADRFAERGFLKKLLRKVPFTERLLEIEESVMEYINK